MSGLKRAHSPNFDHRGEGTPVDMLVLHYTGMQSEAAALARLLDPGAKVSAHYLIDEQGGITLLVEEENRAWHAGRACWRGHQDVNARSIGIELVNPGHEWGYRAFPPLQMEALSELARDILRRWPIPPRNIVGHSDVAPLRKEDPGELFDWRWLAEQGVGLWPDHDADSPPLADPAQSLRDYGYAFDNPQDLGAVVIAFQRHFAPGRCDGLIDRLFHQRLRSLLQKL